MYNPYCSDKDYFKHVYTLILTVNVIIYMLSLLLLAYKLS